MISDSYKVEEIFSNCILDMVDHVDRLLLPISHLSQLIHIWGVMALVYPVLDRKAQVRQLISNYMKLLVLLSIHDSIYDDSFDKISFFL